MTIQQIRELEFNDEFARDHFHRNHSNSRRDSTEVNKDIKCAKWQFEQDKALMLKLLEVNEIYREALAHLVKRETYDRSASQALAKAEEILK